MELFAAQLTNYLHQKSRVEKSGAGEIVLQVIANTSKGAIETNGKKKLLVGVSC